MKEQYHADLKITIPITRLKPFHFQFHKFNHHILNSVLNVLKMLKMCPHLFSAQSMLLIPLQMRCFRLHSNNPQNILE